MGNIDLIIILSTAFLGSVGHCIGMCGGIVVAYTSAKVDPRSKYIHQTTSHLSYNFGRVATYTILLVASVRSLLLRLQPKAYFFLSQECL